MSYRRTPGLVVCVLASSSRRPPRARPKPEDVDAAIKRGAAFLYSRQDPTPATGRWSPRPS